MLLRRRNNARTRNRTSIDAFCVAEIRAALAATFFDPHPRWPPSSRSGTGQRRPDRRRSASLESWKRAAARPVESSSDVSTARRCDLSARSACARRSEKRSATPCAPTPRGVRLRLEAIPRDLPRVAHGVVRPRAPLGAPRSLRDQRGKGVYRDQSGTERHSETRSDMKGHFLHRARAKTIEWAGGARRQYGSLGRRVRRGYYGASRPTMTRADNEQPTGAPFLHNVATASVDGRPASCSISPRDCH